MCMKQSVGVQVRDRSIAHVVGSRCLHRNSIIITIVICVINVITIITVVICVIIISLNTCMHIHCKSRNWEKLSTALSFRISLDLTWQMSKFPPDKEVELGYYLAHFDQRRFLLKQDKIEVLCSCSHNISYGAQMSWSEVLGLLREVLELILEGDSLSCFQVKTFPTGFTRLHRPLLLPWWSPWPWGWWWWWWWWVLEVNYWYFYH